MKRVLVTGATGFIGRHCLPILLSRGFDVHAISSKPLVDFQSDVSWHLTDLLNPAAVSETMARVRPSHLLHLAWFVEPGKYWTSLDNLKWVQASLHLMEAFASYEGKRITMAGTCAEYDWSSGVCNEISTPLKPDTLYGACKHSLQTILMSFSRQTSISAAWGRIFFIYGPWERPGRLVASVVRSLLLDQHTPCSHGNQVRDFLFIEDLAAAFVALLESDVSGPVNLASGQPVSLRDVVWTIATRMGRCDLIGFGEIASPPGEPQLLLADVQRVTREVGWAPGHTLDEGIDCTIEWWKARL